MKHRAANFRSHRTGGRRAGFTLVELVACIVILGTVLASASRLLIDATQAYVSASELADMHGELSIGLDRVVRELRAIGNEDDGGTYVPLIDSVSSKAITWETDSTLELTGSTLELTLAGGTTRTLLEDIKGFKIEIFDESNASLSLPRTGDDCHEVRRIRVTITLMRNGVTHALRSKLFLRSMMLSSDV